MKQRYIDAEKLLSKIVKKNNQLVSLMNKLYYAANYKEWEAELNTYNKITSLIKSLQQEKPDNEDIDKVAQELYEHLYELKRRNNLPTNLYDKQEIIDLWKAGIEYGRNHLKQEQPDVDLEKEIENRIKECLDVKFPTTDIELIKKDVEYTARKFYELGKNARKDE